MQELYLSLFLPTIFTSSVIIETQLRVVVRTKLVKLYLLTKVVLTNL